MTGTAASYTVRPPSWRFDLEIWQDLAEEIVRLEGLDRALPATPLTPWKGRVVPSLIERAELVKDRLVTLGFTEVLTYSFTSRALLDALEFEPGGELTNPLNPTLKYLRPSLLPNLAGVVAANAAFDPHLLYEVGHVFHGREETLQLALVIAGQTQSAAAWLSRIADALGVDSGELASLALVLVLRPDQRERLKIRKSAVTLIELPIEPLLAAAQLVGPSKLSDSVVQYRPLSRYPVIGRDSALLVDESVDGPTVLDFILRFTSLVEDAELFDEFRSDRLGAGKKSLAFHIWYADRTRTLTEDEISQLHGELVTALEQTFFATRR